MIIYDVFSILIVIFFLLLILSAAHLNMNEDSNVSLK